jgi:hypothetical protein
LEAAGVRYALIGGLAVGIHAGVPRATIDVDVAAHADAGRHPAVEALEKAGLKKTGEFEHRAIPKTSRSALVDLCAIGRQRAERRTGVLAHVKTRLRTVRGVNRRSGSSELS